MDIKSLIEKIESKLASQSDEQLLAQKYDAEIGGLALDCVKNANIKDTLLGALQTGKDFVTQSPVGQSAAMGLGGAALGGLLGSQTSSKGEFETPEDFARRRRNSILTGAIAGTAMGAATPAAISSIGALKDSMAGGKTFREALTGLLVNPTTIVGSGGAYGGHLANKFMSGGEAAEAANIATALKGVTDPTEAAAMRADMKALRGLASKPMLEFKALAKYPVLQKILSKATARKFMLPAAGAGLGLGLFNMLTGDKFFKKPAF